MKKNCRVHRFDTEYHKCTRCGVENPEGIRKNRIRWHAIRMNARKGMAETVAFDIKIAKAIIKKLKNPPEEPIFPSRWLNMSEDERYIWGEKANWWKYHTHNGWFNSICGLLRILGDSVYHPYLGTRLPRKYWRFKSRLYRRFKENVDVWGDTKYRDVKTFRLHMEEIEFTLVSILNDEIQHWSHMGINEVPDDVFNVQMEVELKNYEQ
jgi:hypothetical protein